MNDQLTTLLQALEAELHHPGRICKESRLEALLHPEFFEVGRSGQKYDRQTVLDFLLKAATQTTDYVVKAWDYKVYMLENNSALLTYSSMQVMADGRITHAAHRSSIWRLTPIGWQLFYHQGTAFEKAP